MLQDPLVSTPQAAAWKPLCRLAGASLLAAVGLILVDIALSFTGGDVPVGQMTAPRWFELMQASPFVTLRNLGLFNIINPLLTLPLYWILFKIHTTRQPALASLVFLTWLLGVAVYIANNPALSMLSLSQQYAQAAGEAQKNLLAAAGSTLLARGEDFTPGSFAGLFLQNAGGVGMLVLLLRGGHFSRRMSGLGLAGTLFLLVFTLSATFAPDLFQLAMVPALLGGLMMLAWNIWMALQLFRLDRQPRPAARPELPLQPAGQGR
jgi:hypothetical protein